MNWVLTQQGDTWHLNGCLEVQEVRALFDTLEQSKNLPKQLDLSGLNHCDSAGLSCLIYFYQRAKQQGQTFELTQAPLQLQQLSQLYSLDEIAFLP